MADREGSRVSKQSGTFANDNDVDKFRILANGYK